MRAHALALVTVSLAAGYGELAAQRAPEAELVPRLVPDSPLATPDDELNSAFSPDGRTVYFSQNLGDRFGVILVSRHRNGKWSTPEVAPFSGQYSDYDPFVSPDGSQLFWISNRPVDGREKADYDIWVVKKTGDGWGVPIHLDAPVNTDAEEFYPTVAANGNLYFSSTRPGGKGRGDIYRAKPGTGGGYGVPENLGDSVNSAAFEGDPYIAADESYIVFAAYGRPDGVGDGDLYLSSQRGGVWDAARPLGHGINSKAQEYCPIVSPDGKWFYFTSYRGFIDVPLTRSLTLQELRIEMGGVLNGLGNVYRIPIAGLRSPASKGHELAGDQISVGGSYPTQVAITDNSCGAVTVQPNVTTVTHAPGARTLSLSHAGVSYSGTLAANGVFTMQPRSINAGGEQYTISISGQFSPGGFTATVVVNVVRSGPPTSTCRYTVAWTGTKQAS